ncbi:MAG: hypothetical protein EPN23_03415 [Verrucomicrobia bacterium]|nr:MAG: hypothetical protein EPN23_03415 [Verrucomicrobiota bacterium]
MSTPDKLPPFSEEAERGVLGSIILEPARVLPLCAAAGITGESFYMPAHQVVFAALTAMDSKSVDLLTIGEHLKAQGQLEKIGGPQFLEQLITATPTAAHAEYYAKIVADKFALREILATSQRTTEKAYSADAKPCELAAATATELQRMADNVADNLSAQDASAWIAETPPSVDPVLENTFDAGDKVPIIGSSKARKSFFVLQLCLAIASGKNVLRWHIPQVRRVLLIQFELKATHYWRRVHNLAGTLGIAPEEIAGRLHVASLRGHDVTPEKIMVLASKHHAEVIVIDPLYKLADGDENLARDMKLVLAMFDSLAEETGAAILYVHHNPKGTAGDRDARDRGAGSGVIARDFDACIYLTDHKEDGLLVCETLLRNYPPQEAFTIKWQEGHFVVCDDVAAIVRTSANRNKAGSTGPQLTKTDALGVVAVKALPAKAFIEALRQLGFTVRQAEAMRDNLLDDGTLKQFTPPVFPRKNFVGMPDQIAAMKKDYENPKLKV